MPPIASIVEKYLKEVHQVHATGARTAETSFYPALRALLTDLGGELRPKVYAVIHLADAGAGIPDGGLFPDGQALPGPDADWQGLQPARGVIEIKPPNDHLDTLAASEQVAKYARHYRLVLITNLREFALVGPDAHAPHHPPTIIERHRLAGSAEAFWAMTSKPRKAAQEHGELLAQFLLRVMQHEADLTRPEDVAWFLASYAKEAKARIDRRAELPALATFRESLETALGIRFDHDKGEHLFRSTLVQTLFYGVFSAWVLWHRENPARTDNFDWKEAAWSLHVPVVRALFEQIATSSHLGNLNLVQVMDL